MQDQQSNPQEFFIQELKSMIVQHRQQATDQLERQRSQASEIKIKLEQQAQENNELINRLTNLIGEHASLPRTRRQPTRFQAEHNEEQAEEIHSNGITITYTYSA